MPDVKSVLQVEITRLARKEAKSVINPLENKVKELVKSARDQKKKLDELGKTIDSLFKKLSESTVSKDAFSRSRLSPKMIARLRKKLGVTQKDFGKLVGASQFAVFQWESGNAKPREKNKARIIGLRGLGKREVKQRLEEGEK